MKNHDPSITNYTLQVISPSNESGVKDSTIFKLKEENGQSSHEFMTAEGLLERIQKLDSINSSNQLNSNENQPFSELKDSQKQIELLKILIKINKRKLKELRFVVTDRITSAMTRTTLLKTGKSRSFSESEEKWLDESLNDLAQLSLVIEDWTRLCEIIDPKNLSNTDAVKSMVTDIISLN